MFRNQQLSKFEEEKQQLRDEAEKHRLLAEKHAEEVQREKQRQQHIGIYKTIHPNICSVMSVRTKLIMCNTQVELCSFVH